MTGLKCSFNRSRRPAAGVAAAFGALLAALAAGQAPAATAPMAAEQASCQDVRLPDIGWTDVTATTARTRCAQQRGYRAADHGAVGYLGHLRLDEEMPDADSGGDPQALHRRRLSRVPPNGAKYTLAVPAYAYEAGLQLCGHSQVRSPAGSDDLRHRARQRRQSPHSRHDPRQYLHLGDSSCSSRASRAWCRAWCTRIERLCSSAGHRTR